MDNKKDDVSTSSLFETSLEVGIDKLFENDCEYGNCLTVREVNNLVRRWSLWTYENSKIFGKHKRPSTHQIKRAMNNAGYKQIIKRLRDEDGYYTKVARVYVDIKLNPEFKFLTKK